MVKALQIQVDAWCEDRDARLKELEKRVAHIEKRVPHAAQRTPFPIPPFPQVLRDIGVKPPKKD